MTEAERSRILVVDDEVDVAAAVAAVLRAVGHSVVAADSGEAAIAHARESMFDLAVCDRHMPAMDGIELLEKLRELQPMCSRVLLTAGLDLATTIRAVNRGAVTCVIEKPVRAQALRTVVAETLASQRRLLRAYEHMQREHDVSERQMVSQIFAGDYIRLAVQPIIAARDSHVFGYEALLRCSHPVLDSPGSLIAAAERQRSVDELADHVVTQSLAVLDKLPRGMLFINVHPTELGDPDALGDRLGRLLAYAGRIVLEITERSSIYDVTAWEQSVEVIRGLGFEIAVDDLGAGYSALAVLAELKPKFMKVDMSIVRDVDLSMHKQRLFDLLCRFADATASSLVAEGIETEREAAAVLASGAQLLQGYLYGRPRLLAPLQTCERGVDAGVRAQLPSSC